MGKQKNLCKGIKLFLSIGVHRNYCIKQKLVDLHIFFNNTSKFFSNFFVYLEAAIKTDLHVGFHIYARLKNHH